MSTQLRAEEFLGLLEEHRRLQREQALRWMRIPKSLQRQIRNILFIITNQKNPCILCFFKPHCPPPVSSLKKCKHMCFKTGRCKRTFCTITSRLSQTSFTCNHLSGGCEFTVTAEHDKRHGTQVGMPENRQLRKAPADKRASEFSPSTHTWPHF